MLYLILLLISVGVITVLIPIVWFILFLVSCLFAHLGAGLCSGSNYIGKGFLDAK